MRGEGLEQVGTVLATDGAWAWVEVARRGGCGGCSAGASCGVGVLSSLFGRRPVRLRVRNAIEARPGEQVVVAVAEGSVARGSVAVYAPLLIGLLAGAALGDWLGARAGLSADGAAMGLGLLGLGLGAALVRRVGRRPGSEGIYQPVLKQRRPG